MPGDTPFEGFDLTNFWDDNWYALKEMCIRDRAAYHPHKALNRAIAQHLMQGDLQENLDRL